MTYIEFLDSVATENICSCLTMAPDRVIYIGDNHKVLEQQIAIYSRFLTGRDLQVELLGRTVSKTELKPVLELLQELVDTYDDCVFDVTGGEEILILALGMICASNPDKNIQVHKVNLRNGMLYDWDMDGNTVYRDVPMLSVEENICIYGGALEYGDVTEDKTYRWELTEEFISDVDLMWSLCRYDVRMWNTQIGIFAVMREIGTLSEDGLTVSADRDVLCHQLQRKNARYQETDMLRELLRYGLVIDFDERDTTVSVTFKDCQITRCLTKAGNALEMKVFLLSKGLQDKSGEFLYNDVINGARIDWDGAIHDGEEERIFDTENEVDVLLMRGLIPIFISCKNGSFGSEELYKLDAVAERFGGPYAKKVLVTTCLSSMGDTGEYIRQRAADMRIRIISDAQLLEDAAFAKALKNL